MEAARDALDGAIAALFTSPRERTDDATHTADSCGCGCPLDLPDAWRALRDFPVLARWVVTTWQRHAETMAPLAAKKTRRAGSTTSTRALDLRAASVSSLCMRLYQCGLLANETVDDTEVVAALLQAMTMDVFPRALQHRLANFHVRFRLMEYALSVWAGGARVWMEDACVALQQELRDKSAQGVAHNTTTPSTTRKSKKRSRESIGGGSTQSCTAVCERCATHRNAIQTRGRSRRRGLVDELTKWRELHEPSGSLLEAIEGLCKVLNAPDVVRMLDPVKASSKTREQGGRVAVVGPTVRISRSLCEKIVESICCGGACASSSMWRLVWRRESAKVGVQAKLSLEEVVAVCATADQFTRQVPSIQDLAKEKSIGVQVVMKVMQEMPPQSVVIVQILQVIRGALHRSMLSTTTPLVSKSLRAVFIYYVRQLFQQDPELCPTIDHSKSPGRKSRVKPEPQQPPSKSVTISELLECLHTIHEIVTSKNNAGESPAPAGEQRVLFELWYAAILRLSCQPAMAPPWSMFMAALAQCCEDLKSSPPPFITDFGEFVSSVVKALIVSNGTRLCSPGSTRTIEIPADATSRNAVETMLSMIMSSAGASVTVDVLFRVVVAATRSEQIHSWMTLFRDGGGIQRLLFPSLAAFISAAGPEAIDSRFISVILEVYDRIKRQSLGCSQVRVLVYLLWSWDSHCERSSLSLPQGETSTSRQGMRIALQLRIWEDVVQLYAVDTANRLSHENRAFLNFLMQLLRSVDSASCPLELEGSLFSVVSAISMKLQQPRDEDPSSKAVAHSDETVDQFLSVFGRCSSSHHCCKGLLDALVKNGKLEDLVLSLRRWLGILAASPQSLPRDTRVDLAVVTNRLIYHLGENVHVQMIRALLMPVDPVLISALQAYSSVPTATSSLASAAPSISIVRLSLIVRSYLETTCVPDLLALTTAIADALLNATTQSSRDGLLKLLQGFGKVIIAEVIVEKLHDALLLVGDPARTRVVDNAFAVITAFESLQKSGLRSITFSSELVSLRTTERWLPVFLTAGLSSDSAASSTALAQAEAILLCVAHALDREERDEDAPMEGAEHDQPSVFSHAYALVALLSTVEAALLRAERVTPLVRSVQDVHTLLRGKLLSVREERGSCKMDGGYLLGTANNQSENEGYGDKSSFTSGRVHIDTNSATGVPLSGSREWQRAVGVTEETTPESMAGVRFFVPFASWLRTAFRMPRHQNRPSENVFVDMVLQFYLPVEFNGETSALTAAWIDVWIERSLSRARCVELPTLQRKVLLQLMSCDSPWPRLVQCAQSLLEQPHSQTSVPRDTVIIHIVDELDLTTLCSMRSNSFDASRAMASDITRVLQEALSRLKDGRPGQLPECLRLVTPLFEVFVRCCLAVSSSSPPVKGQDQLVEIEDMFVQVGAVLRELLVSSQDSEDAGWCRSYFLSLVARWKRVYSHLNRSHSSRLLSTLATAM